VEKQELDMTKLFDKLDVYYVEKTKKLVFWNNLLNQKGCDASNMYDEENEGNSDEQFSDDEQNQAFKKIVHKVKKQRKRKAREFEGKPRHNNQAYKNPGNQNYKKREVKHEQVASQYQAPYPYVPQYDPNMPLHPQYQHPYQAPFMPMHQAPPPNMNLQHANYQYAMPGK
jgi:hypothetical protein